jgi:hypothetical protein
VFSVYNRKSIISRAFCICNLTMARSNESIHLYLSDREQQVLVDVAEYGNGLATRTRPAPEIGRVNKGSAVSHHGKRSGPAENLANSDEGGRQGFFGVLERSFVRRGTTTCPSPNARYRSDGNRARELSVSDPSLVAAMVMLTLARNAPPPTRAQTSTHALGLWPRS